VYVLKGLPHPPNPLLLRRRRGLFCRVWEFFLLQEEDAVILKRSVSGVKNLRRFDVTSVFNGKKHPIGSGVSKKYFPKNSK